jgi:hypothetical protein
MPGMTPKLNLPYPLGTDFVVDGDDAIHNLGLGMENSLRYGHVSVSTNSNGDALITLTPAFPTQLLSAVVNDAGDPVSGPGIILVKVNYLSSSASGIAVRLYSASGGVLPTYTVFLSFIAIGR